MHIFITGVAGFLGSNLADFYLKKKYKVSGCDNLIGGSLENVDKRVKFYKADIENYNKLNQIIKNVDIVCHAAAYAHEGLSNFSPFSFSKNNFVGSVSVFTAAINNGVKRIVFCSSMARYGNLKIPFKENDEPKPVDPYGISKLAAEKIDHNFSSCLRLINECLGKLVICGLGKSGHVAKKISATLSSSGTPSVFLHPSEALHGDLGILSKKDIIEVYNSTVTQRSI